ncbi:MAG TPA: alanine racemase [Holophaga sp.]|nr:alanine racemase [Holophaga sp.]
MAQPAALIEPSTASGPVDAQGLHCWLEVDRAAFEGNVRALQGVLGGQSRFCLVMKADAYGHGLALLMPTVLKLGISCLGITDNAEAGAAREAGFTGRLIRLRVAWLDEVAEGFGHRIEELVGSLDQARGLSAVAARCPGGLRCHLALNSGGMSREGLELSGPRGREDALAMLRLPGLRIAGIMTHFPVRSQEEERPGSRRFLDEASWVLGQGGLDREKVTLHCANSYAALNVPEARMDMVRAGGILYKPLDPDTAARYGFRSIAQFKSRVGSVNAYPAGSTVSYDRTFTLVRDSRLANVLVGYADGYRSRPAGGRTVLVGGRRAPVVGKGTMNTIMVDVTDHPEVRAGDEVVLFGRQGSEEITLDEYAKGLDCATWEEMATSVGRQSARVLVG